MFSSISPHYDFLNHLLSGNIDRLWRRKVARQLVNGQTCRVLDLCSGTGDLAFAFAKRLNGHAQVVGADFSLDMLRIGARKAARSGSHTVRFVESDALRLPFPDATFDAVAVAFGLRNIVDWREGLAEMVRVVRPGGQVAVLEFSLPRHQPLRWLYLAYFTRLLPWIGNRVSGSTAYGYLTDSVLNWPAPEALSAMMREAGMRQVRHESLSGGIACLHRGIREPQ